MRVTSILSLALVIVFRPSAADVSEMNAQCYTNNVQFDGDRLDNPLWSDDKGVRTLSDCLLDCSLTSDANDRPCMAIEWSDGGSSLSSTESRACAFAWACDYTEVWGGGSVFVLPTTTASPTRDCDEFNIDGFLTDCSADFPAEQEALVAVEARVSTLESDTATSDSLAETHAAVEAVTDDLSAYETATNANLAATDANLAATDVAVGEVSIRVNSIEETLSGFSSARMATAQFDTLPTNTGASLLFGDKDLLIVISLAVNTVLFTALLAVLCRSGKGYKAVGTFAQSDSEMAELQ